MKPLEDLNEHQARVLSALRAAGRRGITRHDFEHSPVYDGGATIERTAARIFELRRDFEFNIQGGGKREGVKVYVLASEVRGGQPRRAPLVWGYERRYQCPACFGNFRDEDEACGRTIEGLEPPEQIVTGCRKAAQQVLEVDRVAA